MKITCLSQRGCGTDRLRITDMRVLTDMIMSWYLSFKPGSHLVSTKRVLTAELACPTSPVNWWLNYLISCRCGNRPIASRVLDQLCTTHPTMWPEACYIRVRLNLTNCMCTLLHLLERMWRRSMHQAYIDVRNKTITAAAQRRITIKWLIKVKNNIPQF